MIYRHMRMVGLVIGLLFATSAFLTAIAATPAKTTELTADTIEYDAVRGVMTAQGAVKLTNDNTVITGDAGEYNTKTKEAIVLGNVKAVQTENTLTAAEIRSYDNKRFTATGNALLVRKGGTTAAGPHMEYFPEKQYAIITGGARLTNPDGVLTASRSEAFFAEDRATATGNVHIVSDVRKLDAVSDDAVYYGINGKNGKAVLTGNVVAIQDGNVLTGNHVTIYLDDKVMDSDGRSKLIIKPTDNPVKEKN